jgi:hypothetical protein
MTETRSMAINLQEQWCPKTVRIDSGIRSTNRKTRQSPATAEANGQGSRLAHLPITNITNLQLSMFSLSQKI